MKDYYRLLVEQIRDVVSELACDQAQELCDGIREL